MKTKVNLKVVKTDGTYQALEPRTVYNIPRRADNIVIDGKTYRVLYVTWVFSPKDKDEEATIMLKEATA